MGEQPFFSDRFCATRTHQNEILIDLLQMVKFYQVFMNSCWSVPSVRVLTCTLWILSGTEIQLIWCSFFHIISHVGYHDPISVKKIRSTK